MKLYAVGSFFFAGAMGILLAFMENGDGELDAIKGIMCLRFSVFKWR